MAKKTGSSPQPTLFKHDIPQMPEGYYSSGPNPNLRRFVEEHATPYDPATDDYNIMPFSHSITSTKATAIYNMHTYWSKKPHDAIQQYIRHYTQPGDIVLDPFCGSGGTALAALMEGRAAIAIDLSPAATFITKNYCTPVDVDELQRTFGELQVKVKPEMDWLYETRCDRCDGKAMTAYTVYSQVFQCPRCLEKFPLYGCVEAQSQTLSGKPKTVNVCPNCYEKGLQEIIRSQSKKFGSVPVVVFYKCNEGCNPELSSRSYNDANDKKRMYFEKYDVGKVDEIKNKEIPYWYPKGYDMRGFNRYQRDALRLYDVIEAADMFTKRNLWALALIRHAANDRKYKDVFLFALTAISLAVSRMQRYSPDSGFPNMLLLGTYYIPQIGREIEVSNWYGGKIKSLIKGLKAIQIKTNNLLVSTSDARTVDVNSNTIDYIFTDPPYADKIQYGELNFVWESWLGSNTDWLKDEIIVNDVRHKTEKDWAEMIKEAMAECYRVLKPGHYLSLCYHDTSEGTWSQIQDIMAEVGFSVDKSDTTLFIDTSQKSFNQLTADKVTKRDLVINFRKPRDGEIAARLLLTGEENPSSFSEKAQLILREALDRLPGSPADRLYDELVSRMVRKGQFQRHNFDELFRTVAEEIGGRWYLLETADTVDETESKKENAAAQKLEAFMQKYMKTHPGEYGVHYSNLFEEYLPIADKPRRLLQDWLPEYFFKTEDGTWRPPASEEERQAKLNLRLSGELRRIKRFANALSAGVPPADRDRPSNPATLAEWIYQCRRSGLYDVGRVLYERGGLRFDGLKEARQLQVEEDYQICVKRGMAAEPKKTRKKKQPSLFDGS